MYICEDLHIRNECHKMSECATGNIVTSMSVGSGLTRIDSRRHQIQGYQTIEDLPSPFCLMDDSGMLTHVGAHRNITYQEADNPGQLLSWLSPPFQELL